MSWGTQVKANVYVSRVKKDEVDEIIDNNNKMIVMFEKELLMLTSSTPRDVVSDATKKEGDIISDLRIRVDEILEAYKECVQQNVLLEIIKENIDQAIED